MKKLLAVKVEHTCDLQNALNVRNALDTVMHQCYPKNVVSGGYHDERTSTWWSGERVRLSPQDYVCIGCEVTVAEHETVFESRAGRLLRGAAVDAAYVPLSSASSSSVPEDGE
eukprot:gene13431-17145_t